MERLAAYALIYEKGDYEAAITALRAAREKGSNDETATVQG
jgi:hypothetical protein